MLRAANIFQRCSFAGAILPSDAPAVAQGCLVQPCSPSLLAWGSCAVEAPLLTAGFAGEGKNGVAESRVLPGVSGKARGRERQRAQYEP